MSVKFARQKDIKTLIDKETKNETLVFRTQAFKPRHGNNRLELSCCAIDSRSQSDLQNICDEYVFTTEEEPGVGIGKIDKLAVSDLRLIFDRDDMPYHGHENIINWESLAEQQLLQAKTFLAVNTPIKLF